MLLGSGIKENPWAFYMYITNKAKGEKVEPLEGKRGNLRLNKRLQARFQINTLHQCSSVAVELLP